MTSLKLPEAVERDVRLLLSEGEKIKAIVLVRCALGVGLREGKELVEGLSSLIGAGDMARDIETEIRADERARIVKMIRRVLDDEWLSAITSVRIQRLAEEIERGES